MTSNDATAAVDRLAGWRVLVVGDLVLDEYVTGRPARISREAPVLILEELEREDRAGSAGSPAANVVALGSRAAVVGAVGDDAAGQRLTDSLRASGIGCDGLVCVPGLPTSTKTRVLAEGFTGGLHGRQQVLRLDRVALLPAEAAKRCVEAVGRLAPLHDLVLLSDYRGGVMGDEVLAAVRAAGRPVAVDSQGDVRRFAGVDLLKVNQAEARAALGSDDVLAGGMRLRDELGVAHFVVTLGSEGMALFDDAGLQLVPAARVTEVFDVTGAGDTVIAVMALGLAAGLPLRTSAVLANAAAGLVVRRLGVATVTPAELKDVLSEVVD